MQNAKLLKGAIFRSETKIRNSPFHISQFAFRNLSRIICQTHLEEKDHEFPEAYFCFVLRSTVSLVLRCFGLRASQCAASQPEGERHANHRRNRHCDHLSPSWR
jgi:hypothetical protein